MKNKGIFCLILICAVFIAFTGGFFLGRNMNHTYIEIHDSFNDNNITSNDNKPNDETETELININTATLQQLQTLPGIGVILAQRIIDYREQHGNFASVADIMNVSGIGQGKLDAIIEYITTGG